MSSAIVKKEKKESSLFLGFYISLPFILGLIIGWFSFYSFYLIEHFSSIMAGGDYLDFFGYMSAWATQMPDKFVIGSTLLSGFIGLWFMWMGLSRSKEK